MNSRLFEHKSVKQENIIFKVIWYGIVFFKINIPRFEFQAIAVSRQSLSGCRVLKFGSNCQIGQLFFLKVFCLYRQKNYSISQFLNKSTLYFHAFKIKMISWISQKFEGWIWEPPQEEHQFEAFKKSTFFPL